MAVCIWGSVLGRWWQCGLSHLFCAAQKHCISYECSCHQWYLSQHLEGTSLGGFGHLHNMLCCHCLTASRHLPLLCQLHNFCCLAWAAAAAVFVNMASELNFCILSAAPVAAAAATTPAEAETLSLKFFSIVGLVNLICWSGAIRCPSSLAATWGEKPFVTTSERNLQAPRPAVYSSRLQSLKSSMQFLTCWDEEWRLLGLLELSSSVADWIGLSPLGLPPQTWNKTIFKRWAMHARLYHVALYSAHCKDTHLLVEGQVVLTCSQNFRSPPDSSMLKHCAGWKIDLSISFHRECHIGRLETSPCFPLLFYLKTHKMSILISCEFLKYKLADFVIAEDGAEGEKGPIKEGQEDWLPPEVGEGEIASTVLASCNSWSKGPSAMI